MAAFFLNTPCRLLPETDKYTDPSLFRPVSKTKTAVPGASPNEQDQAVEAPLEAVVCRQCLNEITSVNQTKEIHGSHTHTFANPEGIVFEIGCYGDAWGCGYIGPASAEFTWFAGYVWRIAVCTNCHAHLGWRFSTSDGYFFHGLITSRIRLNRVDPSQ